LSLPIFIEECLELEGISAVQVFSNFQHLPWAMLLDTCNNQLSDGRYDIIVHSPVAKLVVKNKQLVVTAAEEWSTLIETEPSVNKGCPFERLEEVHNKFKSMVNVTDASPLPFLCGALGYFNYDLNIQLDGIQDTVPDEYSSPDLAVGIYDQSLIFDNKTNKVFCCYIDNKRAELLKDLTTDKTKTKTTTDFQQLSHWQANQTESEYQKKLQRIDDYLHSGDCYQINFAQRFDASYQGSEWQAYRLLRDVNKAPFSSFIRLEENCILSVSPERFLQVKSGVVETKPIKGTRKRALNDEDDKKLSEELLNSEKDRAENLMIVDLLRNDLSKHCEPHSVVVPALFKLESYPAVHHMVSTILGKLKASSSPIQLLKGAFPGGSITGAPKHRAMQIIQELEPNKRSIYCGSIGYIGVRDDMDTSICIRTVLAENNRLYCWAGGGIVLDSEIASEYQESLDKVAKILPVLEETMQIDTSRPAECSFAKGSLVEKPSASAIKERH
jgi:para-aminobenzoate synthetase component 1